MDNWEVKVTSFKLMEKVVTCIYDRVLLLNSYMIY